MRPTRRLLTAVPAAALVAALLAGCSSGTEPAADPTTTATSPATADPGVETPGATELSYPGEEGRTAVELLLEADPSATVEDEGENAFVTGIGGVEAGESEFWALYVDGEPAQVGAGSLVTEDGQEITWRLEAFE